MNHYFTNDELKSEMKKIRIKIREREFDFFTDNGVFSKKGLDFGSRVLINELLDEDFTGNVLDIGTGYGAIGIILSSFFDIDVDMVDVNKRALHLAKMNARLNNVCTNVFYSDIYSDVNRKYNIIVTNPPIRAGKRVVYDFLFGAKDYLLSSGVLYFVINKDQGAKSVISDLKKVANVEVLKKNKGFLAIKCVFD